MSELICPYCNYEQDDCRDECEPDFLHETECEECEKVFGFYIEYYPCYTECKLDCRNGKEHDFKQMNGAPNWHFFGRYKCSMCGEEKAVGSERLQKLEERFDEVDDWAKDAIREQIKALRAEFSGSREVKEEE